MTVEKKLGDCTFRFQFSLCASFYNLALRLRQLGCHAKADGDLATSAAFDYGEYI